MITTIYNVSASSLFALLTRARAREDSDMANYDEPLCCCLEFEGDNPTCRAHKYLGDEPEGSDNSPSAQWKEHGYY